MGRSAALILLLAAAPLAADAAEGCFDTHPGIGLHIDNNLFAGSVHDADYTGGFALQVTPRNQSGRLLPHRVHDGLDALLRVPPGECRRRGWQFGLLSITPGTLRSATPVLGDRPFASLLSFASTAMWDDAREGIAWQSTLEIGALGLDLAESLHVKAHRLVGDERPNGYQFQISEGGEPTARYVFARHRLITDSVVRGETLQAKSTLNLSAGYLTEASASWTVRWGRIDSAWQGFTPELADYLPSPTPTVPVTGTHELYAFAGARVKLRAYNALNQGQLRHSEYYLHSSELENWLGEIWIGAHWQPTPGWAITYTARAQTPELRHGFARRANVWAGLSVSHWF